jgi:hypothetical protein
MRAQKRRRAAAAADGQCGRGGKLYRHTLFVVAAVVTGEGTPDIEDLGSVLCDSSIQTLRLPTISLFSPMVTQVRQRNFCAEDTLFVT